MADKEKVNISKSVKSYASDLSYKKRAGIIIVMICLLLAVNIFFYYYSNSTGLIQVQTVSKENLPLNINVKGVAIRDEASVSQKNTNTKSPKIKMPSGICEEIIEDGEYISYRKNIAYVFSDENERQKYVEFKEAQKELEKLKSLKSYTSGVISKETSNLNLTKLLAQYNDFVSDDNFSNEYDEYLMDLAYRISTNSKKADIDKSITTLESRISSMRSKVNIKSTIVSPSAGYFVNSVDGCENVYDYKDVETEGIKVKDLKKILKKKPETDSDYFGKIVYQNTWFFVFSVPEEFASEYLKRTYSVLVSFPGRDIYDVPMKVSQKQRDGKNISVSCKCEIISPEILHFRIEDAIVTVKHENGFKIPNESLVNYGDIQGVYTKIGNRAIFKPAEVVYTEGDYSVVKSLDAASFLKKYNQKIVLDMMSKNAGILYKNNIDELKEFTDSELKDEDKFKSYLSKYQNIYKYDKRSLSDYDKVIIKGRNLYDGKFIN